MWAAPPSSAASVTSLPHSAAYIPIALLNSSKASSVDTEGRDGGGGSPTQDLLHWGSVGRGGKKAEKDERKKGRRGMGREGKGFPRPTHAPTHLSRLDHAWGPHLPLMAMDVADGVGHGVGSQKHAGAARPLGAHQVMLPHQDLPHILRACHPHQRPPQQVRLENIPVLLPPRRLKAGTLRGAEGQNRSGGWCYRTASPRPRSRTHAWGSPRNILRGERGRATRTGIEESRNRGERGHPDVPATHSPAPALQRRGARCCPPAVPTRIRSLRPPSSSLLFLPLLPLALF